jgi:uncharacterized protein (TIGR02569 family)
VARWAPDAAVLAAFGGTGRPDHLPGGEGRSWRCGDVVLKPVRDADQAVWVAEVLVGINCDGRSVPEPVRAGDGRWIVDGWSAMRWVDAQARPGRWVDIIRAGRRFHAQLSGVPRPAWMGRADDWWRRADRVAWEQRAAIGAPELVDLVEQLRQLLRPVLQPSQAVHADLCGNVMFDAADRPVIIDFSPYWRPVERASAVVAVDAFEWEGAGTGALHWLDDVPEGEQLLVRAAMFRLATSAEVAASHGLLAGTLDVHRRTVEHLERLSR